MKLIDFQQYVILFLIITNIFSMGLAGATLLLVRHNDKTVADLAVPSWAKKLIS
jgi:hypothetical protein